MELNQIFYIEDYTKAYKIAVNNNWSIQEIEADEKGRRFKLVENKLTQKEILQDEMQTLKNWLDVYYTQHEQKYRRLKTLNILTDDNKDPYDKLIELYQEAEAKRKHIQEIERLLNE